MKRDVFSATKRRITLISIVIVFLCLIVFAVITQVFYSSRLLNGVDKQLITQERILNEIIFDMESGDHPQKDIFIPEGIPPKHTLGPIKIPLNLIVIIYENNKFSAMSNNLYFDEDNLPEFPKNPNGNILTLDLNGYKFRGISTINNKYQIQVLSNIDVEMASIRSLRTAIIFSLVILVILALLLSAYLTTKVMKPVREAYEKQVYFVQDASHEMRTPLAVIKGKLELLAKSRQDTIGNQFEHISKVMSEIRGLEKLNSDLLLLSKEDLEIGSNITKVNLDDFINDISEFYVDLAEIKEKSFIVTRPRPDIEVTWDYNKIKRAVIILIENAFKYTEENGEILLNIQENNKSIKITVKDNGIGIKEEDKKRIFDRFYRSEYVRGKNINGTGIGLSLLKSICSTFGIKLKVNSKYNVGSEFILDIPKIIK